jgi:hypothetical protein
VRVASQEDAAKTNAALQRKLAEWETYTRGELDRSLRASGYKLLTELPADSSRTLIVDAKLDVRYGNRALRYWAGFGAGKGGVNSVLTAIDSKTQQEEFRASAASDLAIGAFGGDIGDVLKENVGKLIAQFPPAAH